MDGGCQKYCPSFPEQVTPSCKTNVQYVNSISMQKSPAGSEWCVDTSQLMSHSSLIKRVWHNLYIILLAFGFYGKKSTRWRRANISISVCYPIFLSFRTSNNPRAIKFESLLADLIPTSELTSSGSKSRWEFTSREELHWLQFHMLYELIEYHQTHYLCLLRRGGWFHA